MAFDPKLSLPELSEIAAAGIPASSSGCFSFTFRKIVIPSEGTLKKRALIKKENNDRDRKYRNYCWREQYLPVRLLL